MDEEELLGLELEIDSIAVIELGDDYSDWYFDFDEEEPEEEEEDE